MYSKFKIATTLHDNACHGYPALTIMDLFNNSVRFQHACDNHWGAAHQFKDRDFGYRVELTMDSHSSAAEYLRLFEDDGDQSTLKILKSGLLVEVETSALFGIMIIQLKAIKKIIETSRTFLSELYGELSVFHSRNNAGIEKKIAEAFFLDVCKALLIFWKDICSSSDTPKFRAKFDDIDIFKEFILYDATQIVYGTSTLSKICLPWLQCLEENNLNCLVGKQPFSTPHSISIFKSSRIRNPKKSAAMIIQNMDSTTKLAVEAHLAGKMAFPTRVRGLNLESYLMETVQAASIAIFEAIPAWAKELLTQRMSIPVMSRQAFQSRFAKDENTGIPLVKVGTSYSCYYGRMALLFGFSEDSIRDVITHLETKPGKNRKVPHRLLPVYGTQLKIIQNLRGSNDMLSRYLRGRVDYALQFIGVLPPFTLQSELWTGASGQTKTFKLVQIGPITTQFQHNCPTFGSSLECKSCTNQVQRIIDAAELQPKPDPFF
jgi:hypothetical protein